MTTNVPPSLNQFFLPSGTSNEPPIDNFEQWAKLVKAQMVASLNSKSRQSPSRFITTASTPGKARLNTMKDQ